MLKDESTIPSSGITNERYPRLIVHARLKRMADIYFPYPDVGAANESAARMDFIRKCTNPPFQGLFYYHLGRSWLTVCHRMRPISGHGAGVSDFLRADDKIIDELKLKMNTTQNMEFDGRPSTAIPDQAIGTLRTKQPWPGFAEPGGLWLLCGQGWMCVRNLSSGQADRSAMSISSLTM